MTSRLRGALRRVAAGAAAATLLGALLPTAAAADPALTVEEARAQVDQLEYEAAAIDQQYVDVKTRLAAGRSKLKTKQGDVKAQTAEVAQARLKVGQVALAQFQNRNLETAAQLFFTEETDDFLSQISTVEKVSQNQNTVLQDYQEKQAELTDLTRSAQGDLAALEKQEKELGALSAASDKKIAESKAVLAKLTEEQRAKIAAEEKRLLAEARAAAEAADRSGSRGSDDADRSRDDRAEDDDRADDDRGSDDRGSDESRDEDDGDRAGDDAPASSGGKGAKAIAFARSQLGKPYGRNAAGPGAYDCSGLTSRAWQAAGVSLPRTSQAQASVGRAVSRSELQAGDLVFFYSPISHVALYVGNGQILHAPRPGRSVEYSKMSYMPFAGARRPA